MDKNLCVIFAAGDFDGDFVKKENHFVIAADAGFHHLEKLNISPDILLGDFDTIKYIPKEIETISFPPEKDYTDSELAILEGISRGYKSFIIYGALGGKRLEHTLSNIKLCEYYTKKGFDITLSDGNNIVKCIHNSFLEFDEDNKGFISLFSLDGKAKSVSIEGLKYELCDTDLSNGNPTLCVSNEFIGKKAKISVKDGTITIIYQRK